MSVLKLYTDAALTAQLTADSTAPDEETSLNGTDGDTANLALWLAVDQTTLSAGIDDSVTTIPLSAARFADTDYPVIIIDSEKMLITAGNGTTSLTVTRGYDGTTSASHSSAAAVRLSYDCTSVVVDGADTDGTDESGWLDYCDDDGYGAPDGSWEAPHSVGSLAYNASVALWRRVTVPASTPAQYKSDLVHRVSSTIDEHRVS